MSHATQDHAKAATTFNADSERVKWHDAALWFVREKRDKAAASVPQWEDLRSAAAQIKRHTLAQLPKYLEQFEANAKANGIVVHWARDGREHNLIVEELLATRGIKQLVKSKSMLTEECDLNPFLEKHGITVIDSDLGERIIQLNHEHPSHIVLPAIHLKKEEVGEIFHQHLGTPKGLSEPTALAQVAREHLRQAFFTSTAALTGANFAVADSGMIAVCTNEGNADLGVASAKIHIASIGIEKLIPRASDLPAFIRLLGRSATGQHSTVYTSHFRKPLPGAETHFILVDNKRSDIHGDAEFYEALACIRCGACMNTCPIYRRSGGHSYAAKIPGPIGSVIGALKDPSAHHSLPFASSLCGSCTDVCPVKIPLHHMLLDLRGRMTKQGQTSVLKKWSFLALGEILASPTLIRIGGKIARVALRISPRWLLNNPLNPWARRREMPPAPQYSFFESLRREGKK